MSFGIFKNKHHDSPYTLMKAKFNFGNMSCMIHRAWFSSHLSNKGTVWFQFYIFIVNLNIAQLVNTYIFDQKVKGYRS